ncbi:intermembrane transport protein PqiB [Pseudoalteromonas denitrificans]|uniref:Paraquat-inducible protein B n=1 Tax=Pseudoalteromonas denitrificans DSM 6059 TaxID=1123010 RepID=A0A1I1FLI3_9GAMM|nr:intermembrane transport protein PqiB [Pseudoalteromonas denitrificans]SFB99846.1 paraquat-inducible protein B [Pseudoalteromonas denitrificans DSM 6059]
MTQTANITQGPKISPIWILPFIALFVGIWMVFQYQNDKGEEIFIRMPHAEGIITGKTQIKVRSVNMGIITDVKLSDNQKYVMARAEINKRYKHLLTNDAKIWVVKPRIDQAGVSGLNTLLSGVYLEFSPGNSKESNSYFTLLTEPPLIANDIKGGRYSLLSRDSQVIEVGTGLYYKGYEVGQIEAAHFDWQEQTMSYQIFIKAPFQNLVTFNTVFWVNSGIEVDLSADGINVKTGSLSKLLKGGISFSVPQREKAGDIVSAGHIFSLSKNYKKALEQRYFLYDYFVIQFEQSIRGLNPGAPVEYRGIRIGTVVESPAMLVVGDKPAYFGTEDIRVPVLIKVEYKRIFHNAKISKEFWQNNLLTWLNKGMRASLKPGNLLTGALYIDLDIYPDAPKYVMEKIAGHNVLPSISSGFSVLTNQVSEVLTKFNKLNIEGSLTQFENAMVEYQALATQLNILIKANKTQAIPDNFNQSMQQVTKSMAQFDKTMKQFRKTMSDYEKGSQVYQQMHKTMSQLKQLTQELQPFLRNLNEQPDMFIFDRNKTQDIEPRSLK